MVKFAPSPKMSSYLVAVVVGEFAYVEDRSADGVLVRVYTPPSVKEQGRFALHVATKVLPYYKEYFQVAYPLPKMDLVAIGDFSAGELFLSVHSYSSRIHPYDACLLYHILGDL